MAIYSQGRSRISALIPGKAPGAGLAPRLFLGRFAAPLGFLFLAIQAGCQGNFGGFADSVILSGNRAKSETARASLTGESSPPSGGALRPADRMVFARCAEKDAQGRSRCVWIRAADPRAALRWRNPRLEEIFDRPAERRPDPAALMKDSDPVVGANAAIMAGRSGDPRACDPLSAVICSPELPLPMRCAAAESLACIASPAAIAELRQLLDQYGRFTASASHKLSGTKKPGPSSSTYIADLHAELLRGLARHVDPADDVRFRDALRSPSAEVRREALRAWAAGTRGELPVEAVDLRTGSDVRVRIAAIEALAARRHPRAMEYLAEALRDQDIEVRTAAAGALGGLKTPEALAELRKLLKDPSPAIRGAAASALAGAGATSAWEAANDASWRVRRRVAESLAELPPADGAAVAEQLITDRSPAVQSAAVEALGDWPIERSGPLLFRAMTESTYATRKAAAAQLAAHWPPAREFSVEAPADRQAEILRKLQAEFAAQFGSKMFTAVRPAVHGESVPQGMTPREVEELAGHLERGEYAALRTFGDRLPPMLEQWRFQYRRPLPEPVYREVLPQCDPIFDAIDRLEASDSMQRRKAAAELANAAAKKPLSRLAMDRVRQLLLDQQDPLVWQTVLQGFAEVDQAPVHEIACTGVGHPSAEIRRRACEYLAAHPRADHVSALLPALKDREAAVVCAAIRALSASGGVTDGEPFRPLLGSENEYVQLEAAKALVRFGDPLGKTSLERLTYSNDPTIRARTATAMGDCADPAFTPHLIRLLGDRASVARSALESLPKVVGDDVSQTPGQPLPTTTQRILLWKRWFEKRS
jgi:HEAT repeat protein